MSVTTVRKIPGSPFPIGEGEQLPITLDTAKWAAAPASPVVTLADITTGTEVDVSATNLSGSATVNGSVITLPLITNCTRDRQYLLRVRFTGGGATFVAWAELNGER